ncbi:MAG: YraN family protein [Planctomycetes bacterium]|nr:YraN family protein [Planctomycetota bacterium]
MPLGFLSAGRRAERRAARHLSRLGFRIIERNIRTNHGEIDIVAIEDDCVVLVEVRFRREGAAAALKSLDARKIRAMRAAAVEYRRRERLRSTPLRIDLVAVSRRGRSWHLDHIRAAVDT